MKKTGSRWLLCIAMAATLTACATTPVPTNENTAETATVCRETGLTNAADSRMGQLECGPATASRSASRK